MSQRVLVIAVAVEANQRAIAVVIEVAKNLHGGDSVSVRRKDGRSCIRDGPDAPTVGAHEKDVEVAPSSADVALKNDLRAVGAVIGGEVLSVTARFRVARLVGEQALVGPVAAHHPEALVKPFTRPSGEHNPFAVR